LSSERGTLFYQPRVARLRVENKIQVCCEQKSACRGENPAYKAVSATPLHPEAFARQPAGLHGGHRGQINRWEKLI
jgi:hypothetical protein